MDKLLITAPQNTIPPSDSKPYKLLKLFSMGKHLARDELNKIIGGEVRIYLQDLWGDKYGYWLIHKEMKEFKGKKQAHYSLDERHFSGDWELDKDARAIARRRYADRSLNDSKSGLKRIELAIIEKEKADELFRQRFEGKEPKGF
ncbi:hypothetical protein N9L48_01870 [Psychrosphaera sp.]|nr:hypothetical protein [Psychrosphaera sp.]